MTYTTNIHFTIQSFCNLFSLLKYKIFMARPIIEFMHFDYVMQETAFT